MAESNHHLSTYLRYVVVALAIVLVVLFGVLVHQYISLRRAQFVSAHELLVSTFLHKHGPVTASDVSFIRSWMTFDYVNKLFGLPPSYLEDQLSITDPRYPEMSIGSYANRNHVDVTTLLGEIDTAVKNFLTNSTST
jgi:hypothetical protein